MNIVPKAKRRVFYGWWIVLAGALSNLFIGGTFFYGSTAFIKPIIADFGWSYTTVSAAFSLRNLEEGVIAPAIGFMVDRYGPRKLMLGGMVLVGLGYILLSRTSNLWTFYGSFTIISIAFSFIAGLVLYTAVATWFKRRLGLALGLLASGFGVSGAMVPLLVWLISLYQWRTTLVMVGVMVWALGIPLALVMRHRPEQYGYLPDGDPPQAATMEVVTAVSPSPAAAEDYTWREALHTQAFWLLGIASSLSWVPGNAIFVHIIPHLTEVGISRSVAGLVVTFITAITIAGRLGFGWLGDRMDKRYVMAISYALQCVGVVLFAQIRETWHLIPFLIIFCPGYGGAIPVRPALQREYWGLKAFGTIMGLFSIIGLVTGVASPVVAGWLRDTLGNFRIAFLILDIPLALAVPLILLVKKPQRKAVPPPETV